ncbi:MAG: RNA-processing protein [Thaumarchaeota archaeon]|nr:MAG: RNA-processing protein [Nitrososphaerota archaeon]
MGVKGKLVVPVPKERLGVVIGKSGTTRRKIEDLCNVKLWVDSVNNEVVIMPRNERTTIADMMKAKSILQAIALGFNPEIALSLLDDMVILEYIDLGEVARNKADLKRIKGRIIGEEGKAKRMIEEMSGAKLVIGEKHVGIIGDYEQVRIAREAVEMLISGRQHKTVYDFLRRQRHELKRRRLELWEKFTF